MTAERMHAASAESTAIVDAVLDYSRRRMLSDFVPLDKPQTPEELIRLTGGRTITDQGLGATRALATSSATPHSSCAASPAIHGWYARHTSET